MTNNLFNLEKFCRHMASLPNDRTRMTVVSLSLSIYIFIYLYIFIIFSGNAAQRGLWPPRSRGFVITYNDAPQSVGLLWTSDQLVVETST
jgi:hypothetical protein